MRVPENVCLIGFGEVGFNWAKTLLASGYEPAHLTVLYLTHESGRAQVATDMARKIGVTLVEELDSLPESVELWLHATTTASAEAVTSACLPYMESGQLWIDLNSTGPAMKARMADAVERTGAVFGDGAIMAPASEFGHRTPVWISGAASGRFRSWAGPTGMPVTVIEGPPGSAASVKMCRSLILKGLAASLIEGLAVAELAGVAAHVRRSLVEDLGEDVLDLFCSRFIRRTMQHAQRRSVEVSEAVEMANELGWEALHASGVVEFLQRVVSVGGVEIAEQFEDDGAVLRALGSAFAHHAAGARAAQDET